MQKNPRYHGDQLHDIKFGKDFLHMTPKPQATRITKIDKLDYIKMENFCAL